MYLTLILFADSEKNDAKSINRLYEGSTGVILIQFEWKWEWKMLIIQLWIY